MEVNVYTRKAIAVTYIIDFISKEGVSITIENVEAIKDWKFSDCRKLPIEINNAVITQELNKNNIILIYATANRNINCGLQIEYNKYGFYEYEFYFDTNLIDIDTYYINEQSLILYNKITEAIKELIEPNDLIICGIGEETSVASYDDVNMIIQKSSILQRWILPNEVNINNYILSKNGELCIYDNKEFFDVN